MRRSPCFFKCNSFLSPCFSLNILSLRRRLYRHMTKRKFLFLFFILLLLFYFSRRTFTSTAVPVTESWLATRQRLLSEPKHVSKILLYTYMRGGSTVFSRAFELANRNDSSLNIVLFEPLDAFYSYYHGLPQLSLPLPLLYHRNHTRRIPSTAEQIALTSFLANVLTCNVDSLPMELLAHHQFIARTAAFQNMVRWCLFPKPLNGKSTKQLVIQNCMSILSNVCGGEMYSRPNLTAAILNHCHETIMMLEKFKQLPEKTQDVLRLIEPDSQARINIKEIDKFMEHRRCINHLPQRTQMCWEKYGKPRCARTKSIVAKVIRASYPLLEPLILRIPDIHIIYYVRDPRAIAYSRVQRGMALHHLTNNSDPVSEARALCARMRDDIRAWREFETKYPGISLRVHYEDFIENTEKVILMTSRFIRRPALSRQEIENWRKRVMHSKIGNGPFGTLRTNATRNLTKWRQMVTAVERKRMNEVCWDVLNDLGYLQQ